MSSTWAYYALPTYRCALTTIMAYRPFTRRILGAVTNHRLQQCRRAASVLTKPIDVQPAATYPLELAYVTENYDALHEESLKNPERFWGDLGRRRLRWMKNFDQVMDCDMNQGKMSWFNGGVLNATENCLDRHVEEDPNRVALIWEKDEPQQHENITYKELLDITCQLANALKRQGVKKGDRVVVYMPTSPYVVASMMACARIGAVHSVVYAGFSPEALRSRILDAQATTVITANEAVRDGKIIPLKAMVDEAVEECDCVKQVFVAQRTGVTVPMYGRDIPMEQALNAESTYCPPEPMNSEDMLYILYTSGSTAKPKGIVHTHAGYLLFASTTYQYTFDYHPGDIFCCAADIGWIAGHTCVVYGPLLNGATSVCFESTPIYPDPGRYWEVIERLKVNQFFTAPTAVRLLIKSGDKFVKKYDRSSCRIIAVGGEPLNENAYWWLHNVVGEGRLTVVDNAWQTETGAVMLASRPAPDNSIPKPGFPMRSFFGIEPVIVNQKGEELTGRNVSGMYCVRRPWPGIARTIYGDHDKYLNTYFRHYPGLYFTGDGIFRDADGHLKITGRVDDVIKIKGRRIGTAELEQALNFDPRVAESAVVGYPHEMFGEGIYAFVILKDGVTDSDEEMAQSLKKLVKKKIGSFAVPQLVMVTSGLPKTRSGKIMRRILRQIASNRPDDLGDISTLAEPMVVADIVNKHRQMEQK